MHFPPNIKMKWAQSIRLIILHCNFLLSSDSTYTVQMQYLRMSSFHSQAWSTEASPRHMGPAMSLKFGRICIPRKSVTMEQICKNKLIKIWRRGNDTELDWSDERRRSKTSSLDNLGAPAIEISTCSLRERYWYFISSLDRCTLNFSGWSQFMNFWLKFIPISHSQITTLNYTSHHRRVLDRSDFFESVFSTVNLFLLVNVLA